MFTIELTQGPSWCDPSTVVDRRECQTLSIAAAVAEARYWLIQTQRNEPQRGATHYRVLNPESGTVIGGPP